MKLRLTAIFLLFFVLVINAQEHEHDQEHETRESQITSGDTSGDHLTAEDSHSASKTEGEEDELDETIRETDRLAAPWSSFPNLHPMFVHFPVVLLIIAFFAQVLALFAYRKFLSWVILVLIIIGFVGGLLAAEVFHPMVSAEAPDHIRQLFGQHEFYAYTTLWISGIALILKIVSMVIRLKTWAEIVVSLFLLASASIVSLTGHLGSQMVFIEQVGPGGRHLGDHQHGD